MRIWSHINQVEETRIGNAVFFLPRKTRPSVVLCEVVLRCWRRQRGAWAPNGLRVLPLTNRGLARDQELAERQNTRRSRRSVLDPRLAVGFRRNCSAPRPLADRHARCARTRAPKLSSTGRLCFQNIGFIAG